MPVPVPVSPTFSTSTSTTASVPFSFPFSFSPSSPFSASRYAAARIFTLVFNPASASLTIARVDASISRSPTEASLPPTCASAWYRILVASPSASSSTTAVAFTKPALPRPSTTIV